MKGNISLNPLFCLFIPQELFLSSPSPEFTLPPPLWPRLYVAFFSGSSNLKGVSYDTTSASENVVDSFSRIWLVLACKLETHFDKFLMECRQLVGSNPLLLVNTQRNVLMAKTLTWHLNPVGRFSPILAAKYFRRFNIVLDKVKVCVSRWKCYHWYALVGCRACDCWCLQAPNARTVKYSWGKGCCVIICQ